MTKNETFLKRNIQTHKSQTTENVIANNKQKSKNTYPKLQIWATQTPALSNSVSARMCSVPLCSLCDN